MTGSIAKKTNKKGITKFYPVIFLGTDVHKKKKYKWYPGWDTRKQAEKEMRRILVEEYDSLEEGKSYLSTSQITIKSLSKQWLDHKKRKLKPSTIYGYERYLDNHIIPYFGDMPIAEIKPLVIQRFYDELVDRDTLRPVDKKISPGSIKQIHNIMSGMFKYAMRMQLISKLPTLYLDLPQKEAYVPRLPMPEDIAKILNYYFGTEFFFPILIGAVLGLRRGEVLGLAIDSFNYEKRTLKITQTLIKDSANGGEIISTPKTKKSKRMLLLDDYLCEIILDHIKWIEKNREIYGDGFNEYNLLCVNQEGNYIKPDTLTKKFKAAVRSLELDDKIRLHDLRHYVATRLFNDGVQTKTVAGILGHSTTSFTENTYIEFNVDGQEQVTEVLTKRLKKGKFRSRYKEYLTLD